MVKAIPDILAQIVEQKKLELAVRDRRHRRPRRGSISQPPRFLARSHRPAAGHHRGDQEGFAEQGHCWRLNSSRPRSPKTYEQGGAAALSVLTDEKYFQAAWRISNRPAQPCSCRYLRKDFTIDAYHVHRGGGARRGRDPADRRDSFRARNARFRELAERYRMAALVEVHDADELEPAIASGARIIGVNNRDLHTFEVDLETSLRLAEKMPAGVDESHRKRDSLARRRRAPARGRLSGVPGGRASDEIGRSGGGVAGVVVMMVKICGITNREDALAAVEAGASAIGFNFYRESPRYISPTGAAMIAEKIPASCVEGGRIRERDAGDGGEDRARCRARRRATARHVEARGIRIWRACAGQRIAAMRTCRRRLRGSAAARRTVRQILWRNGQDLRLVTRERHLQEDHHRRRPGRRQRAAAIEASAALGRRRLLAHRKIARPEGPRKDDEVCGSRSRSHDDATTRSARPLRTLRRPLRSGSADGAARRAGAGLSGSAARSGISSRAEGSAAPTTPAVPRRSITPSGSAKLCGGAQIYIKREDLLHTGAHKINNCLGQALLARRMGKQRIIAETGAGQHGVATATVCALFGLECIVYMGEEDMRRQRLNVFRMRLLGAKVVGVTNGSRTLKDAISEAMRDWVTNVHTTHYLLGSALGAHPYPMMVRDFHRVIGEETRRQILEREGRLPDSVFACVGGGSNAIGMFHAFHRTMRACG